MLILKGHYRKLEWSGRTFREEGDVTIHKDKKARKPHVLLADVPMPDRAILLVWLMGMEQPPVKDAVYLDDYLRFVGGRESGGRPGLMTD
jgi:hypothetical protein